jgi:DNA-binding NarL/FixJ family response regulator
MVTVPSTAASAGTATVDTELAEAVLTGTVPTAGGKGLLSTRELEIAVLVAGGRSNKDIAAELFISPATVARHIANIMKKLGFHSRTQIAMWTLDN